MGSLEPHAGRKQTRLPAWSGCPPPMASAPTSPHRPWPGCAGTIPGLSVEIVTVTRRALQQRSGPGHRGGGRASRRCTAREAIRLGEYMLGMYASRDYLAEHGTPAHAWQRVDEASAGVFRRLDAAGGRPGRAAPAGSGHAGRAELHQRVCPRGGHPRRRRHRFPAVLHGRPACGPGPPAAGGIARSARYWMVLRPDSLRQPAVAAVVEVLRREARNREATDGTAGKSGLER